MKVENNDGRELIFLVSQPRSGSTLLQHILASHSQTCTLPEPWVMLPLVYALRTDEPDACILYNTHYAALALRDFIARIPDGATIYEQGVRQLALGLYRKAIIAAKRQYFLDKTPRYYLIIPELLRLFPAARFVLLIRNPLAVLASILNANLHGNWRELAAPDRRLDLLDAPRLMVEGAALAAGRAAVVHYEELVSDPEATVQRICKVIGLQYEPPMLEYGDRVRFTGTTFVDHKSIYKHSKPVSDYANAWIEGFDTTHKVALARDYLRTLGPELIESLGYDFEVLLDTLDSVRVRSEVVVPFRLFMARAGELRFRERLELRMRRALHRQLGILRRTVA